MKKISLNEYTDSGAFSVLMRFFIMAFVLVASIALFDLWLAVAGNLFYKVGISNPILVPSEATNAAMSYVQDAFLSGQRLSASSLFAYFFASVGLAVMTSLVLVIIAIISGLISVVSIVLAYACRKFNYVPLAVVAALTFLTAEDALTFFVVTGSYVFLCLSSIAADHFIPEKQLDDEGSKGDQGEVALIKLPSVEDAPEELAVLR